MDDQGEEAKEEKKEAPKDQIQVVEGSGGGWWILERNQKADGREKECKRGRKDGEWHYSTSQNSTC